jgi:hypothetical protein
MYRARTLWLPQCHLIVNLYSKCVSLSYGSLSKELNGPYGSEAFTCFAPASDRDSSTVSGLTLIMDLRSMRLTGQYLAFIQ